jgi:putative membrane protein
MHAGEKYVLREVLFWTRREIYWFLVISAVPTAGYYFLELQWLAIPWLPIALVGTAVAFLVSFKNSANYDRLWEARQIWGAIVNSSRSWGIMVRDFVTERHARSPVSASDISHAHRILFNRHFAWLTSLRFQLRQPRKWETSGKSYNREYRNFYKVPEWESKLDDELRKYLAEDELKEILKKENPATQLLSLQSAELKRLLELGLIEDFRHMELEKLLVDFYTQQGKCERIKNFPYPRQYATINLYFVWLFIFLVPFGMLQEFEKLGEEMVWFTVPASVLVSWVFHTMEKIGEATENPFEGSSNDVPMAAISRSIEIDMREMLGETDLPEPLKPVNNILM